MALLLCLGVNILTPLAVLSAGAPRMRVAVCGTLASFLLLLLAFALLVTGFLTNDFSVVYIAQHSSRLLRWPLRIAAAWGGHEGSLLLWVLLLCGWSALFAWRYRRERAPLFALTLCALAAIAAALLLFVVLWSDPFARIFPPAIEGRDLNPMLQHPGLIFHPPLLYLGYGGLTVAAAVALASLLRGDFSRESAYVCRQWALPGWAALTLGIVLGSWWAYCELGWGGWWFWDPVENASLLPWLSATALLHSLSACGRRGGFRHWSLLLAIATLLLSLLGTLIVRSGILVSVHAFALDNVRAVPLFTLFTLLSLTALGLYGWRGRSNGPPQATAGRHDLLLATLLLFCAALGVVLVGTLYPMIYGLLGLGRLSVGAPYFNLATLPFGALMLVVIGLATIVCTRARRLPALLAHGGVLLFALGVVASGTGREERSVSLAPGEQAELAGYRFRFDDVTLSAKGNYTAETATFSVWQGNRQRAQLRPERRFYLARRQQTMEPGIAWTPLRDWYAALGEKTGRERYAVRLYVQAGVRWVWGGGLLMVAGGLLSLRRRRE